MNAALIKQIALAYGVFVVVNLAIGALYSKPKALAGEPANALTKVNDALLKFNLVYLVLPTGMK